MWRGFQKYLDEECKWVAGGKEQLMLLSQVLLFVYLLSDPDLNLILQEPSCYYHAQNFNCDTFRLRITVSVKERGKLRVTDLLLGGWGEQELCLSGPLR